jgi:hypothetical protein
MITDALIGILISFLNLIASTLTTQADVPAITGITSAIGFASGYYSAINVLVPMSTFFAIIAFDLVFEGVYFVYKLIRWGYRKVPGVT